MAIRQQSSSNPCEAPWRGRPAHEQGRGVAGPLSGRKSCTTSPLVPCMTYSIPQGSSSARPLRRLTRRLGLFRR